MIKRMWPVLLWFGLCLAPTAAWGAEDAASLRLVPFPKQVTLEAGQFALDRPLTLEAPPEVRATAARLVGEEFERAGFRPPATRASDDTELVVRLSAAGHVAAPAVAFRDGATGEDYHLRVQPDGVTLRARAAAGLLVGVATLVQLIRANRRDGAIPCLAVDDWPSLRWRAFQDDLTRGPSTKLAQLERDAARGAMLKLNVFTYYMQHQFAFTRHPIIGPLGGSLTPDELAALVEFARPLGVHVMGNQQSFAHMQHTLAHEAYAHLREDPRTLSPVREETYRLLDDLYADVLPLLEFDFFNVCCDETWGLGTKGPSKALAERIGPGGVYVRHVRRVYDLVHGKYGKRMMMWGDIILKHPDQLDEIPKDVIMLTWGYRPRESFEDQIVPFAESGYDFFVCPGVNNWRRVLPDFPAAVTNIHHFVRDGARHGALGVLITSWDDDGENLNAPNWHGFAWGAECAWNASATDYDDFRRRVGAVLFGETGDHFGKAVELLSDPRLAGMTTRTFWGDDSAPTVPSDARKPALQRLDLARRAITHLEACRREATVEADLLDAFLFGARRLELYNQRIIDRLDAVAAYDEASQLAPARAAARVQAAAEAIRRTRDTYAALKDEWQRLWLRENKPYALDGSLRRYEQAVARYDRALEHLAAAARAAQEGKPLPPAQWQPLDHWIKALENTDGVVRLDAAGNIAAWGAGAKPAVPALTKALGDPDPDLRAAAARALGAVGPAARPAVPSLLEALGEGEYTSEGEFVASVLSSALGNMGKGAVPQLIVALDDENRRVVGGAAGALHDVGPDAADAVPRLVRMLREGDQAARGAAIWGLMGIGPEARAAVPVLIETLRHEDFHTQYWSCEALGRIGPDAKTAVPALIDCLREDLPPSVRRHAAAALGGIGPDVGREGLDALIGALDDPTEPVREDAVVALGKLGPFARAAAGAVEAALAGDRLAARVRAAETHWRLTGSTDLAVEILIGELEYDKFPWQAAEVLGRLGPAAAPAVDALAALLESPDAELRVTAAETLGRLGAVAKPAVPALRRAAENPDPDVRHAAVEALKMIDSPPDRIP